MIILDDHTRVKLTKIDNNAYSDYINANYIEGYKPPNTKNRKSKVATISHSSEAEYCYIDLDDIQNSIATAVRNSESAEYSYIDVNYIEGYNGKKAYIATQAPKIGTVNDFWRMVWQENVKYIVNLVNVMEGDKKITEQYWPNAEEHITCGNIKINYISSKIFADYEYRTFVISQNNIERKIEHLHFTSWPDHGVPLYLQSLVPFLRRLLAVPRGVYPILVHCSDGVGSTGTVILCDLCLKMAAAENVLNVLKALHHLREQRVDLVDSFEQYKLVHLVLLECLLPRDTKIECNEDTDLKILRLLQSNNLKRQLHYINETTWQNQAIRAPLQAVAKPEWSVKDRFRNIVPTTYGQVYLSKYPVDDDYSDYINAVRVDGFRCPQQFIVTQQPLRHTVSDFWRMIDEQQVTTIVSLNKINIGDETSCIFWPTEKTTKIKPVPYLLIEFHENSRNDCYNVITIHLHNKEQNIKRTVNLITLKKWISGKLLPNSEESLLKLWEKTETLGRGNIPIVVTCYDGAKASGLFVALSFVIEKIKFEQECDVCLAVQTVRLNRKQFVTKVDQFAFLYRAVNIYLQSFNLYSNFNTLSKKKYGIENGN